MAVTEQKKLIRDFLVIQKRSLSLLIVSIAICVAAAVAGVQLMIGADTVDSPLLWIVTLSSFALSIVAGSIVASIATRPGKDILAAIAHIADEPVFLPLPNPNDMRYRDTGFDTALQAIYQYPGQSSRQPSTRIDDASSDTSALLANALNRMQGSIIALDHDQTVTYASPKAPLYTQKGALVPRLLFGTDSLHEWLKECEVNAVHAERIWRRIPDQPAGQEGQRLFDVFASYEKGAPNETILTLVDQTDFYAEDENDLNFIAFAAHELRGPITVIRGYLDVLQYELDDTLHDDQKELFHRLVVSANRLSSYVNNILNTARYDQRHLSINLHKESLAAIYDIIKDDMELRASAQNRLLTVTIPADLPIIAADKTSLSEVLSNLIDNAIKYSHEGGIVTVSAEAKGDFVEITIEDQGIGMPSSVVSNLFQKFYRSHRSRETVAGSGIGLYISKAIVESHGGTIGVRSQEGKGSVFSVLIPTYASVAETLQLSNNSNQELIKQGRGWIKNHSMYRG